MKNSAIILIGLIIILAAASFKMFPRYEDTKYMNVPATYDKWTGTYYYQTTNAFMKYNPKDGYNTPMKYK